MHKNVFSYFVGFCLSCAELLIMYGSSYVSLLVIFAGVLIVFSLFFIIIKKIISSDKTVCTDERKNHFPWIYDEEHSDFLTALFTIMKTALFLIYVSTLLIPVKTASISAYSLVALIMLMLTVYLKATSSKYTRDDYKIASWENSLSDNERFYLYKSLHSFMTMALLPILTLCFYGSPVIRCAGPFVITALLGWISTIVSKFMKFE